MASLQGQDITEQLAFPARRYAIGDPRAFVAGEAEADEPFLVQQSGRLLQEGHPPTVVLDQVVVGGENGGNSSLNRQGRCW